MRRVFFLSLLYYIVTCTKTTPEMKTPPSIKTRHVVPSVIERFPMYLLLCLHPRIYAVLLLYYTLPTMTAVYYKYTYSEYLLKRCMILAGSTSELLCTWNNYVKHMHNR